MGPVENDDDDIDQVSLNQFTDDFFKPWYKASTGTDDEQIEGEDPIIEVEKIISHRGSGKKHQKRRANVQNKDSFSSARRGRP